MNPTDPGIPTSLECARRAQSHFSALLDSIDDDRLPQASLLPVWSRAHVAAHVAMNARGMTRLMSWAATGIENPMYESADARDREIEVSAILPPHELRALQVQAAADLDQAWEGLPDDAWEAEVLNRQGEPMPASDILLLRERELWLHGLDLDAGGTADDFPPEFVDRMLREVLATWRSRDESVGLEPTDRDGSLRTMDAPALVVRGRAAQLLAWATGRASSGITTTSGAEPPAASPWA
jgi:maleylpyruvate isomerase